VTGSTNTSKSYLSDLQDKEQLTQTDTNFTSIQCPPPNVAAADDLCPQDVTPEGSPNYRIEIKDVVVD